MSNVKHQCRVVDCRNRSKVSPLRGDSLPKRAILGPRSQPRTPISVKFCTANRINVPLGCAKFHVNRCNESPRRGEHADFRPVSKFNTGSLPLRGNPAGKNAESLDSWLQALKIKPKPSVTFSSSLLLPARRRPQGLVVIGVCLSVCLCVCAHCVCPQDISRTGSWITTKFGGWEQGVNL